MNKDYLKNDFINNLNSKGYPFSIKEKPTQWIITLPFVFADGSENKLSIRIDDVNVKIYCLHALDNVPLSLKILKFMNDFNTKMSFEKAYLSDEGTLIVSLNGPLATFSGFNLVDMIEEMIGHIDHLING